MSTAIANVANNGMKNRANSGADYYMPMDQIVSDISAMDQTRINWSIKGTLQLIADDMTRETGQNYSAQDVYDMIVNGEYEIMTIRQFEQRYGVKVKNFSYHKETREFVEDTDPSHQDPEQRILVFKPVGTLLVYAAFKEGCANLQKGIGWRKDEDEEVTTSESEYAVNEGNATATASANASADVNVNVNVHEDEEYSVYDGGNSGGGYYDQSCGCYQPQPQMQFSAFVGFNTGYGYFPPSPQIIYVNDGSDGDVYVNNDNDIDITISGDDDEDPPVVDDGGPHDGGDPGTGGPHEGGDPPIEGYADGGDGRLAAENSWEKEVNNLQAQEKTAGKKNTQTVQNVPETDNLSGKNKTSYSKPSTQTTNTTSHNNQGAQSIKVVKKWTPSNQTASAGKNQTVAQNNGQVKANAGQVKTNTNTVTENSTRNNTGYANQDYWWNKGQYASNASSDGRNGGNNSGYSNSNGNSRNGGNTNNGYGQSQSGRNYSYSGQNTGDRNQYTTGNNRPTYNGGKPYSGSGSMGRPVGAVKGPMGNTSRTNFRGR